MPDGESSTLWGIVSDVDLMRGLCSRIPLTAGNLAALDLVTVTPQDDLRQAAQLMGEHDVAHLIVMAEGRPTGVLSTLDVARAVAREVRHLVHKGIAERPDVCEQDAEDGDSASEVEDLEQLGVAEPGDRSEQEHAGQGEDGVGRQERGDRACGFAAGRTTSTRRSGSSAPSS